MQIEVAKTSGLLDADVPDEEKLYGYHRLADPLVPVLEETGLTVRRKSEAVRSIVQQENVLIDRYDSHLKPPEPKKW